MRAYAIISIISIISMIGMFCIIIDFFFSKEPEPHKQQRKSATLDNSLTYEEYDDDDELIIKD